MPCYEVRTVSVEFKAENRQLLDRAIKVAGLETVIRNSGKIAISYGNIVLDLESGTAEIRDGQQHKLNMLKRAYSKECVKAAARKMQWSVKLQGTKATVNKIQW